LTYVSLHDFAGSDGQNPYGSLAFGPNGELYGTASAGGQYGYGRRIPDHAIVRNWWRSRGGRQRESLPQRPGAAAVAALVFT